MIEIRSGIDRRKRKPPLFSKYWLTGRRGAPRRKKDREKPQRVDRYNPKILGIILVIISLSIIDAIFTLNLVNLGAKEINPLLAFYLERGPLFFFIIKYFLTCASVIILLFSKDFYIFRNKVKARVLFFLVPIPFILVIQWQLYLIFIIFR